MQEQNKIIILQKFDSAISANIIKTKLDAYGIPCFLSGENLSLTTPFIRGGVQLHIFEEDKNQVIQLLVEESLQITGEYDLTVCPNCHSKRILTQTPDRFAPATLVKFILQLTGR